MTFSDAFINVPLVEGKTTHFHTLFLSSNDRNQNETLQKLAKFPLKNDEQVALMTSGLFGLTAAYFRGKNFSTFKIKYVLSIDYSSSISRFWKVFESCLLKASTKDALLLDLEASLKLDKEHYFPESNELQQEKEMTRIFLSLKKEVEEKTHFLSSNEGFLWAKALFAEKRFVHLQADLCDPKMAMAVQEAMKELKKIFDMILLTNVADYAEFEGRLEGFHQVLSYLQKVSDNETYVIDSAQRNDSLFEHSQHLQRVIKKFPLSKIKSDFIPSPVQYGPRFNSIAELPKTLNRKSRIQETVDFESGKKMLLEARSAPVLENATTLIYFGDYFFGLNLIWERGKASSSSHKIDRFLYFVNHKFDEEFAANLAYILIKTTSQEHFLLEFFNYLKECGLNRDPFLKRIENEKKEGLGFLSSKESFEYVQGVFKKYYFMGFTQDPLNPDIAKQIISALKQKEERIDTLYLFALQKEAEALQVVPLFHEILKVYQAQMGDSSFVIDLDQSGKIPLYRTRRLSSETIEKQFPEAQSLNMLFQNAFEKVPQSSMTVGKGNTFLLTPYEKNFKEKVLDLEKFPVTQSRKTFLFQGGLGALAIASTRKSEFLICVEQNPSYKIFWEHFALTIKVSQNGGELLDKIVSFIKDHRKDLFLVPSEDLQRAANTATLNKLTNWMYELGKNSFLFNPEKFQFIKKIFTSGRFVFLESNLLNYKVTNAIASALKDQGQCLDALYISNLQEESRRANKLHHFLVAMQELRKCSTDDTVLIDSHLQKSTDYEIRLSKNFATSSVKTSFPEVLTEKLYFETKEIKYLFADAQLSSKEEKLDILKHS